LSVVLVEQTAEPVPPVHTVPIPADDGRIGRWIGRLQTKRSVGAVGVVVGNIDPQDLRQMTATALLRCADPGRLKANLGWDQIAKTSSSNATATRRLVGSSTASS
jgi:hypothetical protein